MAKENSYKRVAENEAVAKTRMLKTSPQKLNLVAGLIRGKDASKALADLSFSSKRVAGDVKKVLESAIANAENNHQLDVDRLFVSEATVGRAFALKRFRPRARGRTGSITKPFSNLTVVVREREEAN